MRRNSVLELEFERLAVLREIYVVEYSGVV